MIDAGLEAAMDAARTQVPIGVVAAWALAGVIGAGVLFATMRRQDFSPRIGGSLLIVGAVAGALLWSALQPPKRLFKQVHEVVAERDAIRGHRHELQVHGVVVPGSVVKRIGRDEYRFQIQSRPGRPHAVLEARYIGLLPDAFGPGAEIVARGTLTSDGWLEVLPDGIMARRWRD
ncbi:MAG TPA: cytochrome c maturation protein CcmE [Polyangia bacterium]|nr:cytochrome c maturation protein CcmE [Polyangia bacterium]